MSCDVWTALHVHAWMGKTFHANKDKKKSAAKLCFHKCVHVPSSCQLMCECFLFTNVLFCYSGSDLLLKMDV